MTLMKAAVFVEPGRIVLDDKPIPDVGPQDALMRVTTTTICAPTSTSSRASTRSSAA
jgi:threonine dehydrogenase-like Zn-dependent dehydrogenase